MNTQMFAAFLAGGLLLANGSALAQQTAAPTPATTPGVTTVVVTGKRPEPMGHWLQADSPNFTVYSDAGEGDVQAMLTKLERFRYVLRKSSDMPADNGSEPRFVLYYLRHHEDLKLADPEATEHTVALFTSSAEGGEGFVVASGTGADKPGIPLAQQPEDSGMTHLFQAYARHFFYAHFPQRTPAWYIEGYAQYFSSVRFDGNVALVGLPPQAMAAYLFGIDTQYPGLIDYKDILTGNQLNEDDTTGRIEKTQLQATMATIGHSLPTVGSQTRTDADLDTLNLEFQARSWILTHWLLSSPDRLGKLAAYVTATQGGEDRYMAFQRIFGVNPAALGDKLRVYLLKNLKIAKLSFAPLPAADVQVSRLGVSFDDLVVRAGALGRAPSAGDGKALLAGIRAAAAAYPDSAFAQKTLSRAQIQFGDPKAVLAHLQQAVHDAPDNFDAQYWLGRDEMAIAQTQSGDGQVDAQNQAYDAAEVAFTQAAKLDPQSAVNAFWYFRAQIENGNAIPPDAAGAAILAWKLAPDVDVYGYNAGLVYALAGDKAKAIAALRTVADNPRGSTWQKPASLWLDKIGKGAAPADILTAIVTPLPFMTGHDEWTRDDSYVLSDTLIKEGHLEFMRAIQSGNDRDPINNNGGATAYQHLPPTVQPAEVQ